MTVRTGGCQCGKLRFRATSLLDNPHVCHCRMCQKANGNLFSASVGVLHANFTWTRGQPAEFASSDDAVRGFCRDCGTPLYYQGDGSPHISVALGAFDQPGDILLVSEGGCESRLPQISQLGHVEANETSDIDAAVNYQHPDHDTDTWPA